MTAIDRSAEELHRHIEMHRKLVASMLGSQADEKGFQPFPNARPLRSREAQLQGAILETIEVLDESRKAFKSKRLEALRKKLTVLLAANR